HVGSGRRSAPPRRGSCLSGLYLLPSISWKFDHILAKIEGCADSSGSSSATLALSVLIPCQELLGSAASSETVRLSRTCFCCTAFIRTVLSADEICVWFSFLASIVCRPVCETIVAKPATRAISPGPQPADNSLRVQAVNTAIGKIRPI